ncbi:kinase-like domain-containing protein [Rhodocollybia butyracea]|uniref:Kinase-like domain-containing protein n=1 Tax=Rhodocollybia butyracea TaxID=206335 RepID=A0A9P5UBP1_9AGAR|nr:kinase-like domain-containing protein [Rhodocollybia butyracea]
MNPYSLHPRSPRGYGDRREFLQAEARRSRSYNGNSNWGVSSYTYSARSHDPRRGLDRASRRSGFGGSEGGDSSYFLEDDYSEQDSNSPYRGDRSRSRSTTPSGVGYNQSYRSYGKYEDNFTRKKRKIEERIKQERPCRTLFIRNIKYETNSNNLRRQFEEHGEIMKFFDLISTRGMLFVTYYDTRAAERARNRLQGSELGGRTIDVHFSLPRGSEKNDFQGCLQVTLVNTPSGQPIDDNEVRRAFMVIGEIKSIQPVKDRIVDSRYVEFYDTRDCDKARDRLQHQRLQDGIMVITYPSEESQLGGGDASESLGRFGDFEIIGGNDGTTGLDERHKSINIPMESASIPKADIKGYLQRALAEYDAFKVNHRLNSHSRQTFAPQWLDKEVAQRVLDQLQLELDFASGILNLSEERDYAQRLSLLRYLSAKFHVLPFSLIIHDVMREGHNPIGGGGFADIWRGTLHEKNVCLKVLRLIIEPNDEIRTKIRKQFCQEALVWRQLKHPNILPLLGVNTELFFPSFCLISPWMKNKDINAYLRENPNHDLSSVLSDIASGLHYLHSRKPPIIHGDIRGANILVADDLRCCLADFGLALVTTDSRPWSTTTSTSSKGAMRWLAPECIDSSLDLGSNQPSRDVYAFGCTILEILTQKPPFHDKTNDTSVLFSLMKGERPHRPQDVWYPETIWNLTTRCWAHNAQERPLANEIYDLLLK